MDTINFSYNWNDKLTGRYYTTLRKHQPGRFKPGKTFLTYFKRKPLHVSEVIEVKTIQVSQLNEWIARLDTGYSLEETKDILKKMYQRDYSEKMQLDLVLLQASQTVPKEVKDQAIRAAPT